jgi:ABC-2 type transport system ATP-binding protein
MTFVIRRHDQGDYSRARRIGMLHRMNTETPLITITNVDVCYGAHTAVHQVSLDVGRGEVFGLLGPNGAGKSSLLACVEGLQRPNAGQIHVAGYDVATQAAHVKAQIGVQLQKSALFPELTALELVMCFAALYERFPNRPQALALLERFGLAEKADARAHTLSGGQQQRLALALAFVNEPQVVLLDEPTTALDPHARRSIWELIRGMRAAGHTVLLTTHSMEEAEALCDRVAIMLQGRIVALGSPTTLIAQYAPPAPEPATRRPNLEDVFLALTGREYTEAA